ncbi:MAG: TRAP transporter large permease subunit, partial [Paracoccaceae bacterium]|nr:TRAP transporter large permease subunit [Paracoccaceae bacterium]
MTDPQIALMMLGLFIVFVFLGFPIAFTLMAMGIAFGYYAYFDEGRMWRSYNRLTEDASWWDQTSLWLEGFFNNRIFDLFVNQTYTVMSNEVLTAVPLFLFMGYIVERANIVNRLFSTLNIASRNIPGSMGVAALVTCALFATATGIVGAVVTLMGLLALPAMLKARYNPSFASGIICAGGTLGILIPPSIMLIVYAAASNVSIVRLYAAALLPGLTLVGLYLVYIVGRSILQPSVAPKPTKDDIPDVPFTKLLAMVVTSFLPLAFLILAVLGSILMGLATPTEAASIGALGGILLAFIYRAMTWQRLRESVYLTVRTTAMVCWLFVGSYTFSAVFSYLGGEHVIAEFVTSLDLTPLQFL